MQIPGYPCRQTIPIQQAQGKWGTSVFFKVSQSHFTTESFLTKCYKYIKDIDDIVLSFKKLTKSTPHTLRIRLWKNCDKCYKRITTEPPRL